MRAALFLLRDIGSAYRMYNDPASLRNKEAAQAAQALAEIAQQAAQAARDIAAGYASDAVSQGHVPIYATIDGMSAIEVPIGINAIRVNGRAAAGDGEGGLFVDSNNGSNDTFTSSDSRTWYRAGDDIGAVQTSFVPRPDLTTPIRLYVLDELRAGRARPEWARQNGDGTDWALSINRIAEAIENETHGGGGVIHLAKDTPYTTDTPIAFEGSGIKLKGNGGGNKYITDPDAAPSVIRLEHDGYGIRWFSEGGAFDDIRLSSGATRAAAPYDVNQRGLWIERPDVPEFGTVSDFRGQGFVIVDQPGDGILTVGRVNGLYVNNFGIRRCKGHGYATDAGTRTGRVNLERPAFFMASNCAIALCGGHSFRLSGLGITGANQSQYRALLTQVDLGANALDPEVRDAPYNLLAVGEEIYVFASGIGGTGADYLNEQTGGVYLVGRNNELNTNRYINTTQPVFVGSPAGFASYGNRIRGGHLSQTDIAFQEYIVRVAAGARNTSIEWDNGFFWTNLIEPGPGNSWRYGGRTGATPAQVTLTASGTAQLSPVNDASDHVILTGPGNAAGNFVRVWLNGVIPQSGTKLTFMNDKPYDITVLNYTVAPSNYNIRTKSGGNVVLPQHSAITLISNGTIMSEA